MVTTDAVTMRYDDLWVQKTDAAPLDGFFDPAIISLTPSGGVMFVRQPHFHEENLNPCDGMSAGTNALATECRVAFRRPTAFGPVERIAGTRLPVHSRRLLTQKDWGWADGSPFFLV